jgi:hypothetical protein
MMLGAHSIPTRVLRGSQMPMGLWQKSKDIGQADIYCFNDKFLANALSLRETLIQIASA